MPQLSSVIFLDMSCVNKEMYVNSCSIDVIEKNLGIDFFGVKTYWVFQLNSIT